MTALDGGRHGSGAVPTAIEEAGRRAGRGQWVASAAFSLAGRAAAGVADPAARCRLGVAARRHGTHAVLWHGLLPAVAHLDAAALVEAPAAPLEAWLGATAGPPGGEGPEEAARLAALHDLLVVEALALYATWWARTTPWTDGPERRVLAGVVRDLEEACDLAGGRGAARSDLGDGLAAAGGLAVGVANTLR